MRGAPGSWASRRVSPRAAGEGRGLLALAMRSDAHIPTCGPAQTPQAPTGPHRPPQAPAGQGPSPVDFLSQVGSAQDSPARLQPGKQRPLPSALGSCAHLPEPLAHWYWAHVGLSGPRGCTPAWLDPSPACIPWCPGCSDMPGGWGCRGQC